jgi:hypothetical protein
MFDYPSYANLRTRIQKNRPEIFTPQFITDAQHYFKLIL